MTYTHHINRLKLGSAIAAISLGLGVSATSVAHSEEAAENNGLDIEEIIITARKRTESLQEVPAAISVFSASQIKAIGATSISDITHRLPNASANPVQSFSNSPVVRGMSSGARNIGFDSGFGVFIDGAFAGRNATANKILPDIERVEFLPGPQATLFGKNTTVGVLNIVPKKPGDEFEGTANISVGNYGHVEGRLGTSGPISENIGVAFTLGTNNHDGWVKNLYNGETGDNFTSWGGTAQVSANFDNFSIDFLADYSDQERLNDFQLGRIQGFDALPEYTVEQDGPSDSSMKETGLSLRTDLDLESGTLTTISAYRYFTVKRQYDDDSYALPVQHITVWDETQKHFSQEVRFAGSSEDDKLSYLVGGYFQHQKISSRRDINAFESTPNFSVLGKITSTTFAAFTNLDYAITEQTGVELGARYGSEEKKMPLYSQAGGEVFGLISFVETTNQRKVNNFSYTAAIKHEIAEDVNSHFRYSRGFKSGGFNLDVVTNPILTPLEFDDEYVDSFELGLKTQFMDNRLTVNMAGFYSTYKNLQVSQFTFLPDLVLPVIMITNAASARTKGIEFSVDYIQGPFSLLSSVGFADTKFLDFVDIGAPGGNYKGTRLTGPKWTANVLAQYEAMIDEKPLNLTAEYIYRSANGAGPGASANMSSDPLHIVNLRAELHITDDLAVTAWVENLFDKHAVVDREANGAEGFLSLAFGRDMSDQITGERQPPRMWGIDLSYKF